MLCTVCYILKRSVVCLLSTLYVQCCVYCLLYTQAQCGLSPEYAISRVSGDHAPLIYSSTQHCTVCIYITCTYRIDQPPTAIFPFFLLFFNFDCVGVIFATFVRSSCFSLRLLPARPPPTSIIITALVSSPLYCYTVLYWQCTYLLVPVQYVLSTINLPSTKQTTT